MRTPFHIMKRAINRKMLGKRDLLIYYSCNTTKWFPAKHLLYVSKMCARKVKLPAEKNG